MAQTDTNDQVRAVALHTVGRLMEDSRDMKVGKFLATLVADASVSSAIRSSAYVGLCGLHGSDLPRVHNNDELLRQADQAVVEFYLRHVQK
jgi:hypothetical protein